MKKLIVIGLLTMLVSAGTISAQAPTDSKNPKVKTDGPQLSLAADQHDFGKIKEGVVAEYEFKFTNTGNQPLILTNVHPSCGCTTPSWPKEPILPGKSGSIKVSYNSAGRPGPFNKSVTITSNVPDQTKVIYIKGEVEAGTAPNVDPNQSPVRLDPHGH